MTQLNTKNYYRECFNNFSHLSHDLENIIILYIMDLHYYDAQRKLKKHYESYLLVYSERLEDLTEQGLTLNTYPMMYEKFKVFNTASFLREIIWRITMRKFKFYDKDLRFISNYLLPSTKLIVVGFDFIMFDLHDAIQMTFTFHEHDYSPYLSFVYGNMVGM